MNRRHFLCGIGTAVLLPTVITACSKGSDTSSSGEKSDGGGEERPITADEAARLAETLFLNYDLGGATFELNSQLPDGSTVRLVGEVDWTNHLGHAAVTATGSDAPISEVYWSADAVLERIPALTALAEQLGRGSITFVARPPSPTGRHLDALLGIVAGLASQQRDNPLLIQQTEGTAFIRSDTVGEVAVDVLRYGTRNRFSLQAGAANLVRFEGNTERGDRPVVIDFGPHSPQEIPGPLTTEVVDIATVQELYDATTAAG